MPILQHTMRKTIMVINDFTLLFRKDAVFTTDGTSVEVTKI